MIVVHVRQRRGRLRGFGPRMLERVPPAASRRSHRGCREPGCRRRPSGERPGSGRGGGAIMRKIIYWVHSSVDGFVDGPDGEFDWPVMGPELSAYSEALDERVDTLLFGRP